MLQQRGKCADYRNESCEYYCLVAVLFVEGMCPVKVLFFMKRIFMEYRRLPVWRQSSSSPYPQISLPSKEGYQPKRIYDADRCQCAGCKQERVASRKNSHKSGLHEDD